MGLFKGGWKWDYNTLTPGMIKFTALTKVMVNEVMEELAQEMKNYAQDNAPWEDRSGEARSGLDAEASSHGLRNEIVLYHQADYGIWLEVRWGGRYAIILPTIEHFSPGIMGHFGFRKIKQ